MNAPEKLSLTLDKIFDDNYNQSNTLHSKIQTNEDLIRNYDITYQKQFLQNQSLKIILLASILILLLVFLYYYEIIPSQMILFISTLSILVLSMLIIYFQYYSSDYQSYLDRINRKTQSEFASEKTVMTGGNDELKCDDDSDELTGEEYDPKGKNRSSSYDRLLKTDSQYNVWMNGDHKSSASINDNHTRYVDDDIKKSDPYQPYDIKSSFGALGSNEVTYYDCVYRGSNGNGLPIQKRYEKSTIPCDYYIGFNEVAKYKKNGNNFVKV
jgi:hypothetical protein